MITFDDRLKYSNDTSLVAVLFCLLVVKSELTWTFLQLKNLVWIFEIDTILDSQVSNVN